MCRWNNNILTAHSAQILQMHHEAMTACVHYSLNCYEMMSILIIEKFLIMRRLLYQIQIARNFIVYRDYSGKFRAKITFSLQTVASPNDRFLQSSQASIDSSRQVENVISSKNDENSALDEQTWSFPANLLAS